jgi:hypothetical protein
MQRKTFTQWILELATLRNIALLSVGYLAFPLYIMPQIINEGSTGPLDLLFFYDAETVYLMFEQYGEKMRHRYFIGLLTADFIYPLYYSFLIALIIGLIIKPLVVTRPNIILFIFTPYLVILCDFSENFLILTLLSYYPEKLLLLANTVGYATSAKWILSIVTMIIVIGLMVMRYKEKNKV